MRLSRIKLAGFKSFVDPVEIKLPSARVGIIGPNGCGKSNTIDAVRWVMGESSAKHLRGDSMDDVIFTGSSQRQPVSQASVELVFDNVDGSLGGEYAAYAEIALKREVTRDGQSRYLLNNTRCRRRDIRDIFLGTGLGPRSYAIIEQGMVSRLIEAKPEDLRVFLEEAAGISKYKERRRETENRISHTRDNLDRLEDLREEVDKQIVKLKRQADIAGRYQELKADERRLRGELLVLRRQAYVSTREQQDRSISERETELESVVAELRGAETAIEQVRLQQEAASDFFNEVQANYYKVGAEVSRLEQQIEFTRENQRRQHQELADVERARDEAQAHREEDSARILEIGTSLDTEQPAFDQLQSSQQHSAAVLVQAEREITEWRTRQDEFNRRHGESSRTAQVERSRIDQLERNLAAADTRIARLDEERLTLDATDLQTSVEDLIVDEVTAMEDEARLQQQVGSIGEKVQALRDRQKQASSELNDARARAQAGLGRLASLEALQQAALEPAGDGGDAWLKLYAIDAEPRLAQCITAQKGWEQAVELVLGPYLEAVCVADDDLIERCLSDQPEAQLALLRRPGSPSESSTEPSTGACLTTPGGQGDLAQGLLTSKVTGDAPLAELLHGVRVARDITEALAMRAFLGPGESVVTPDGFWLGTSWLRVARGEAGDSVLMREVEITELRASLVLLSEQIIEHEASVEEHAQQLQELESRRETAQHACNDAVRNLSSVQSSLQTHRQRLEQMAQRRLRLDEEWADLAQTREQEREQREISQARRLEAVEQLEAFEAEGHALKQEQEVLQAALKLAREQAGADRDAGQALAIRVESLRSARSATEQNLQRMQVRIAALDQRHQHLSEAMANAGGDELDALDATLKSHLEDRVTAESTLVQAREQLEVVQQRQREHEQARVRHDSRAHGMRETLQNERMASQEVRVRLKTLDEQLAEHEYAIDEIEAALPEDAALDTWAEELARTEQRVNRLGPINLAAIDEHAEQVERKTYLDSQYDDVTEALTTLERAIAKIDRETRTRFRDTFDNVNEKFMHFFPRLFGGGHACLELTGDDLLNTGVSVVAQPPGKRVSNIQLLSGGEKALTAVALVFAFFELNPSPFCMLDEVDAPLDDANVGRFCELVKEMSERVQFIFITHNKVTMEMADQLMGVTMNEPGVSRLVAVDVEEAVELAGV